MSQDLAFPICADDAILDDLERLAREHLLFFRLHAEQRARTLFGNQRIDTTTTAHGAEEVAKFTIDRRQYVRRAGQLQ